MVVGHGTVFLNGKVRCVVENNRRFMVGTDSVPSCSGCPLFNKDAKLAGLVHGDTRHRVKQTFAGDNLDLVSHVVFADTFATVFSSNEQRCVQALTKCREHSTRSCQKPKSYDIKF
jgi:hypothetical protein